MPREPISSGLSVEALGPMLDPARTALVIIDVQNDFAAPDGAMAQAGCDLSDVEPAIDRIEALIAAARSAGATLAFIRVVTDAKTDSKALKLFYERQGYPAEALDMCRAGTPGIDYYRVAPKAGEIKIAKLLFSSFVGTDFDAQLKARGIDTLVVTGLTTECCIDCTVRDAFHHDYSCFLVDDACAAYGEETHLAAMSGLMKNCALAVSSAAVRDAWGDAAGLAQARGETE
jgi:nicotinamidase-related amidase